MKRSRGAAGDGPTNSVGRVATRTLLLQRHIISGISQGAIK
ncbi:hypothetical protein [Streptomyces sp. NPDC002763]